MRWIIYTMTKIYMRRSDTMKWVRRFKVPAIANHKSILMEAYSQTLWTRVGRDAGEWNGRGWYNENEFEMEVQKEFKLDWIADITGIGSRSINSLSFVLKCIIVFRYGRRDLGPGSVNSTLDWIGWRRSGNWATMISLKHSDRLVVTVINEDPCYESQSDSPTFMRLAHHKVCKQRVYTVVTRFIWLRPHFRVQ